MLRPYLESIPSLHMRTLLSCIPFRGSNSTMGHDLEEGGFCFRVQAELTLCPWPLDRS